MDRRRMLGWTAATLTQAAWAQTQAHWPIRPVTLVVPSSAGGGTDVFARALAQPLATSLKQRFVIENRPGASGKVGAEFVGRSVADGHTLLVSASAAVAINPAFEKDPAFDVTRALVPVARGVSTPFVLMVHPSLRVKSVAELVALARREPGRVPFGSPGTGTVSYLAIKMLEEAADVRFLHAAYKGLAPAMQDLVSGQIGFMLCDLPSAEPQRSRLIPIAATEPLTSYPGVPTFAAAGYPAVKPANHFSLFAPAGTPAEVITRLSSEVNSALSSPVLKAKLTEMGLVPVADTPAIFSASLATERAGWADFVKRTGIRPGD